MAKRARDPGQSLLNYEGPTEVDFSLDPPSLDGVKSLGFDTETTTEKDFYERKLVGVSYRTPDGRKGYLPIRHPGGGNYDEGKVLRWAREELAGKTLVCANSKHEIDTMRRAGADFEAMGTSTRDVFHMAALLQDVRPTVMQCGACGATFNAGGFCECGADDAESLGRINVGVLAKQDLGVDKIKADHSELHRMTAAQAAPIAMEDADLAWRLNELYQPRIDAEGLGEVLALEDELSFAVAEMERNGAFLDVPRLVQWHAEVDSEIDSRWKAIKDRTGLSVDTGKWKSVQRLFDHQGLRYSETPSGQPSLSEDSLGAMCDPIADLVMESRQLASLKSKYLDPYLAAIGGDGLLRYQLHQLSGDRYGTVTGRFSSSNVNIQQVSKNSKQPRLLQRWPIRALFVHAPDEEAWLSADASQIEFRIFAHYAEKVLGSRRVADAYRANPKNDFHALVTEWTGLIRDFAKNVNFCKLYGGGPEKIAFMINQSGKEKGLHVTVADAEEIVRKYDREFPEAKRLIMRAQEQAEQLGYVRTLLGRRRRYGKTGERFYSALNAVFQGTAADVMKRKLLELYRNRKLLEIVMRMTVHDESDNGMRNKSKLPMIMELLNEQTTKLSVPILWECGVGANWHEAH